jgi:hypothetical protein
VSNANLQCLHAEATNFCKKFKSFEFVHIPRLSNGKADLLSNKAMDSISRNPYSSLDFQEQINFDASDDSEISVSFSSPPALNPLSPTYDIQQQYQRMGVSPTIVEKQARKQKVGKIADDIPGKLKKERKPREPRKSGKLKTVTGSSIPQTSISSSQVPFLLFSFSLCNIDVLLLPSFEIRWLSILGLI